MTTIIESVRVPCHRCGDTLMLPKMPIDDGGNVSEQWDQVEGLIQRKGWAVARVEESADVQAGRFALCPACFGSEVRQPAQLSAWNPRSKCPKCNFARVSAVYDAGRGHASLVTVEHLARQCRRCGYEWPEACRDAIAQEIVASITSVIGAMKDENGTPLFQQETTSHEH